MGTIDRVQWFKERIGNRVFRNKTSCTCATCKDVYENGVVIQNEMHADILAGTEWGYQNDGFGLQYFAKKEYAANFEQMLCSNCHRAHGMTDDDAGSERQIQRLCKKCFTSTNP